MGVVKSNFVEHLDGSRLKRAVSTFSIAADRKMGYASPVGVANKFGGNSSTVKGQQLSCYLSKGSVKVSICSGTRL